MYKRNVTGRSVRFPPYSSVRPVGVYVLNTRVYVTTKCMCVNVTKKCYVFFFFFVFDNYDLWLYLFVPQRQRENKTQDVRRVWMMRDECVCRGCLVVDWRRWQRWPSLRVSLRERVCACVCVRVCECKCAWVSVCGCVSMCARARQSAREIGASAWRSQADARVFRTRRRQRPRRWRDRADGRGDGAAPRTLSIRRPWPPPSSSYDTSGASSAVANRRRRLRSRRTRNTRARSPARQSAHRRLHRHRLIALPAADARNGVCCLWIRRSARWP